jgi:hypothetical protein
MRELDRRKCLQGLVDKQLKKKAVAERLGLTSARLSGEKFTFTARWRDNLSPKRHPTSRAWILARVI